MRERGINSCLQTASEAAATASASAVSSAVISTCSNLKSCPEWNRTAVEAASTSSSSTSTGLPVRHNRTYVRRYRNRNRTVVSINETACYQTPRRHCVGCWLLVPWNPVTMGATEEGAVAIHQDTLSKSTQGRAMGERFVPNAIANVGRLAFVWWSSLNSP